MQDISVIGSLLPQHPTSSMTPSLTGDTIKITDVKKQFQCKDNSNVYMSVISELDYKIL